MIRFFSFLILTVLFGTACQRSSDQIWDDTLTCSHHVEKGIESLGGKSGDSRQVRSRDDFFLTNGNGTSSQDSIPFHEQEPSQTISATDLRPAKHSPGDPGSPIPGIEGFSDPARDPVYSKIFKPTHFDYNSNKIKGQENIQILQNISTFMKQHPNLFVFIEGHCDKRGPEAYNFALGSRRSNEVRGYLVNDGISPDRLFTISYGKERLIAPGDDDASHRANRRAEFKLYDR